MEVYGSTVRYGLYAVCTFSTNLCENCFKADGGRPSGGKGIFKTTLAIYGATVWGKGCVSAVLAHSIIDHLPITCIIPLTSNSQPTTRCFHLRMFCTACNSLLIPSLPLMLLPRSISICCQGYPSLQPNPFLPSSPPDSVLPFSVNEHEQQLD